MLRTINIIENPLEQGNVKTFETEDVLEFLVSYYKVWPENARIYNKEVCQLNDITPINEKDVENLNNLDGPFYIIQFPGADPFTWGLILSVIVLATYILFQSKVSVPTLSSDTGSSNNALSDRSNKARVNERIPDIFGTVNCVPDLIAYPFKFYKNNIEYEHSYMCIGRGYFDVTNIKEDTTLLSLINGDSCEIYQPFTSPNSSLAPQLRIGDPINHLIKNVSKIKSVDGPTLSPAGQDQIIGNSNIQFDRNGFIIISGSSVDLTTVFRPGDTVTVTNATQRVYGPSAPNPNPSGYIDYSFNHTYSVATIAYDRISCAGAAVTTDWSTFIAAGVDSAQLSATLTSSAHKTGPFYTDTNNVEEILCNFTAESGIYMDNGSSKIAFPVTIEIYATPIDENYNAIGAEQTFSVTMQWGYASAVNVGQSKYCVLGSSGRWMIYAMRITPKTVVSGYSIVEDVKWRDLYCISDTGKWEFGDATTVQTLTKGTTAALAVSDRKLNMIAQRKIPILTSPYTSIPSDLYGTNQVDDIISYICLDKKLGNRSMSEIDFNNIYETVAKIRTYFGTSKATEFCYTFDSSSSFEEIMSSVAKAVNCIAYRRGNQIKLAFEGINNIPTILFNHRNKIPGTETRTVNFGNVNDYDGIIYNYIDATDGSTISMYLPSDQSAVNPNTVDSVGIRNYEQAYFNAYRLYNKIRYQVMDIEFDATQESNICAIADKILVSDGTRSGSIEGEILDQNILELTLSQEAILQIGLTYNILLQYMDGTIDSIGIIQGSDTNKVILARAPTQSLVTNYDAFAKTTFMIVANTDTRITSFIISEKTPKDVMTSTIKATNYDERYYQNDSDFINGIIS